MYREYSIDLVGDREITNKLPSECPCVQALSSTHSNAILEDTSAYALLTPQ